MTSRIHPSVMPRFVPTLICLGLVSSSITMVGAGTASTAHADAPASGTVVGWGGNEYGESNIPAGLIGITQVSAGPLTGLALKSDGTVVAWGDNSSGQREVPAGLTGVTQIAAGGSFDLAVKSDGKVVAWGSRRRVPARFTGITQVAIGGVLPWG